MFTHVMLCFFIERIKMENKVSYEFDKDSAALYAKSNCKKCLGRGYQMFQTGSNGTIRKGNKIFEYPQMCSCTERNMKKYDT